MTFNSTLPLFGEKNIIEFSGDHDFLSNFYRCEILFENNKYPSVENAYVASKTLETSLREKIKSMKPGEAKGYGRRLELRPDWEEVKLDIMETLIRQKFSSGDLKEKLIATKDSNLIEGNWWGDRFWGVDLETGMGKNHLGRILMKIRNELNN